MSAEELVLLFAGDVMTGRGVDQILPSPGDPRLREDHVRDARGYVELAERENGGIPRPVDFAWPWGDALPVLDSFDPDVRVVNVETSITTSDDYMPGKGIHYRMHPGNLGCLTAARPDVCAIANNHVLDFGVRGLDETLSALTAAGLRPAGAGRDAEAAWRPVDVGVPGGRVLVWSVASGSSGVPSRWAATSRRAGVARLPALSDDVADELLARVADARRPGDLVVISVHWGSNWGYDVPWEQERFAERLVEGGVDVVHGHSSHHPRAVRVYRNRLVLFGCGDLIDDYEGIRGYESYRSDLRLLYFASLDRITGELRRLRLIPLQARQMRLHRASASDTEWLRATLERASSRYGTGFDQQPDGVLSLRM